MNIIFELHKYISKIYFIKYEDDNMVNVLQSVHGFSLVFLNHCYNLKVLWVPLKVTLVYFWSLKSLYINLLDHKKITNYKIKTNKLLTQYRWIDSKYNIFMTLWIYYKVRVKLIYETCTIDKTYIIFLIIFSLLLNLCNIGYQGYSKLLVIGRIMKFYLYKYKLCSIN